MEVTILNPANGERSAGHVGVRIFDHTERNATVFQVFHDCGADCPIVFMGRRNVFTSLIAQIVDFILDYRGMEFVTNTSHNVLPPISFFVGFSENFV
jgi:hypothetical protein